MSIHLPTNHFLREVLGAIAGMGIAVLLYLGFQQYSLVTLPGSLVNTSAPSSSAVSTDATASMEAESAERIAERERLIAERLAALAVRHSPSSASDSDSASSPASISSDAPTVPGNLTTAVSGRERLELRAERLTANGISGEPDTTPSADAEETPQREFAGVPASPSESVVDPPPAMVDQPEVPTPIDRPLPESGPAEYGMVFVAFASAFMIVRRRCAIQAAH